MLWIVGFLTVYVLGLFAIVWISIHPFRIPTYLSPAGLGAPQENVEFESQGIRLKGWWLEAPDSDAVMIFAHGYMMNKCELIPEAVHMWRQGISCLVFDHRAQGRSGGKKCGFGYLERVDIAAAVREARKRKPDTKIILLGSSMGSAAIAMAMGDDPTLADLAILDSSYSKLSSATLGWWRFLGGKFLMVLLSPASLIAGSVAGFNPFRVDIAKTLLSFSSTPLLFIHGTADNLALPSEALRNFDAYSGPKKIIWFEGCRHSEGRWEHPEKYRRVLDEFLTEHGFLGRTKD